MEVMMMQRPLAPFRVRPIRAMEVRRTVSAELIREIAERHPPCIKPARALLRITPPIKKSAMRVLASPANDTD
jgi:hypothetical protein